ncbi:hypothetical protein N0B51_04265 [Tsuneonella sp. YG55]|uniref:DUF1579 domain-containing protein n=1 Tax=Tsuneonella litorea TaxID=2976475 RepID=A0A9X2VZW8_9SPHN|nr:hypothetical protein [Tsuneonella litorea]MCT2558187.1 hypothetical protein [Tsuneonella litorea]
MSATIAVLLLAQVSAGAATPPSAPGRPGCEGAAFSAFDFWIGEWDVYPEGKEQQVARSRIEKLYAGCAVRENWMPLKGAGGGSLNAYDPDTGLWHQTWVGSAPGPVFFTGRPVAGGMVLTGRWKGSGPNGEDGLTRMTYGRRPDGSVRQHGEFSGDHGMTWQTTFDLIYRPRDIQSEGNQHP